MITRKLFENQGSYIVRPPRQLLKMVGFAAGDEIAFTTMENRIIMEKVEAAPAIAAKHPAGAQNANELENEGVPT